MRHQHNSNVIDEHRHAFTALDPPVRMDSFNLNENVIEFVGPRDAVLHANRLLFAVVTATTYRVTFDQADALDRRLEVFA